jgi:hypothetical protein
MVHYAINYYYNRQNIDQLRYKARDLKTINPGWDFWDLILPPHIRWDNYSFVKLIAFCYKLLIP